jgi:hypothetical protein
MLSSFFHLNVCLNLRETTFPFFNSEWFFKSKGNNFCTFINTYHRFFYYSMFKGDHSNFETDIDLFCWKILFFFLQLSQQLSLFFTISAHCHFMFHKWLFSVSDLIMSPFVFTCSLLSFITHCLVVSSIVLLLIYKTMSLGVSYYILVSSNGFLCLPLSIVSLCSNIS